MPPTHSISISRYNDQAGNPIEGAYVDQNGDGQIDDADKILNKSPDPKVTMTLGNNFRYKNWDFGINFRASIGNYVYNNVLSNNINTSNLYSSYGINTLLTMTCTSHSPST